MDDQTTAVSVGEVTQYQTSLMMLLLDGLGDLPIPPSLVFPSQKLTSPLSPLSFAPLPTLASLARSGWYGLQDPVAAGLACGSDTAHLSIFGHDPRKVYRGRGAFETIGSGLDLEPGDIAFKSSFSFLTEGVVKKRRMKSRSSVRHNPDVKKSIVDPVVATADIISPSQPLDTISSCAPSMASYSTLASSESSFVHPSMRPFDLEHVAADPPCPSSLPASLPSRPLVLTDAHGDTQQARPPISRTLTYDGCPLPPRAGCAPPQCCAPAAPVLDASSHSAHMPLNAFSDLNLPTRSPQASPPLSPSSTSSSSPSSPSSSLPHTSLPASDPTHSQAASTTHTHAPINAFACTPPMPDSSEHGHCAVAANAPWPAGTGAGTAAAAVREGRVGGDGSATSVDVESPRDSSRVSVIVPVAVAPAPTAVIPEDAVETPLTAIERARASALSLVCLVARLPQSITDGSEAAEREHIEGALQPIVARRRCAPDFELWGPPLCATLASVQWRCDGRFRWRLAADTEGTVTATTIQSQAKEAARGEEQEEGGVRIEVMHGGEVGGARVDWGVCASACGGWSKWFRAGDADGVEDRAAGGEQEEVAVEMEVRATGQGHEDHPSARRWCGRPWCLCGLHVAVCYATEHRCGVRARHEGHVLSDCVSDSDPLKDGLPLRPVVPTAAGDAVAQTAHLCNAISEAFAHVLALHPINLARALRGQQTATALLLRGAGARLAIPSFRAQWSLRARYIAPTAIIAGVCRSLAMQPMLVPGATGGTDTDVHAKVSAALLYLLDTHRARTQAQWWCGGGSFSQYPTSPALKAATQPPDVTAPAPAAEQGDASAPLMEVVVVHVKATDEAGHGGHAHTKARVLRDADTALGEARARLTREWGEWGMRVRAWRAENEAAVVAALERHLNSLSARTEPNACDTPSSSAKTNANADLLLAHLDALAATLPHASTHLLNELRTLTMAMLQDMPMPPAPIVVTVTGDHTTACAVGDHTAEPVPVLVSALGEADAETLVSAVATRSASVHEPAANANSVDAATSILVSSPNAVAVAPTGTPLHHDHAIFPGDILTEDLFLRGNLGRITGADILPRVLSFAAQTERNYTQLCCVLRKAFLTIFFRKAAGIIKLVKSLLELTLHCYACTYTLHIPAQMIMPPKKLFRRQVWEGFSKH